MGVLADWQIKDLAAKGMITPYDDGSNNKGRISSGVSSMGYDVRIGYKFQVFSPINATVIDPKDFDKNAMVTVDLTPITSHDWYENQKEMTWRCGRCGRESDDRDRTDLYYGQGAYGKCKEPPDHLLIPPHSFALGESIESFDIPRDILVVCLGKSTYARCGLIVNVTPGEPEWKGKWTIEISNTTPLPAKVYCGEGIMQAIFLRADGRYHQTSGPLTFGTCQTSYKDRKGKYQGQIGVTPPKVEGK